MISMEKIRDFIVTESQSLDAADQLDFDLDLFELNLLDSLGAIKLITFLEQETGMPFDLGAIDFENFRSIRKMHSLLSETVKS